MAKPPAGRPAGVPAPYLRGASHNWQIKVKVPKGAGGPGQIAKSLGTRDHAEALRRAPVVAAEIRRQIEALRRNADGTRKDLKGDPTEGQRKLEGWWAEHRVPHPTMPGRFVIPDHLEAKWEDDLQRTHGGPLNRDDGGSAEVHEPRRVEEYDPQKEAAASRLIGVVLGDRVPVASELDSYLKLQGIKSSYASRTRRAVVALAGWQARRPGGDNVHAVTGRDAVAFADHLAVSGLTTATVNSLTSALSAYWGWMDKRYVATVNPWSGQGRRVVDRALNAEKRPFTDEEVKALLGGKTSRTLHDMMRLAALTGMRLTEIGALRVKGARLGVFQVEASKTISGVRGVPVHPDLKALVARRIQGKRDEDYLIEELQSPRSHGGLRGRKVGEWFTAYRRELKLDDRREGRRQADADFHSFRRWFVTKAEQAGQDEWLVARVVGHKPSGFTFGTYSGGAAPDQALAVVAAVRLPVGSAIDTPEDISGARPKLR
jgi:integrase